jgi:hypothetical protein
MSIRLLVCGGRDFDRASVVTSALDSVHDKMGVSLLIHGDARGADTLAGAWAASRGIPVMVFPADWQMYGKAAGHVRNKKMIDEGKPDVVVAFPGGRGTADMMRKAVAAGLNVMLMGEDKA